MEKFLKEIENLKIKPRNKILRGTKGNYKSYDIGNSMNFYDHRPYVLKDDIRKIDWKAYMRTSKLYVREFTEEKQAHIKVIMDNSLSMNFGNPNKIDIAKTLSLGISYLAFRQMDVFSFITVNEKTEIIEKGIEGKDNFYKFFQKIPDIDCKGKTNYKKLLNINNFKGGITFIISDFFGENIEEILNFLCIKGEEVIAIHILSSEELKPQISREIKLIDKETNEIRKTYINKKIYNLYIKKMNNFINQMQSICITRGVKYVFANTHTFPSTILANAIGGI